MGNWGDSEFDFKYVEFEMHVRQLDRATKAQYICIYVYTHAHTHIYEAETIAREKKRVKIFILLNRRNLDIFKC